MCSIWRKKTSRKSIIFFSIPHLPPECKKKTKIRWLKGGIFFCDNFCILNAETICQTAKKQVYCLKTIRRRARAHGKTDLCDPHAAGRRGLDRQRIAEDEYGGSPGRKRTCFLPGRSPGHCQVEPAAEDWGTGAYLTGHLSGTDL